MTPEVIVATDDSAVPADVYHASGSAVVAAVGEIADAGAVDPNSSRDTAPVRWLTAMLWISKARSIPVPLPAKSRTFANRTRTTSPTSSRFRLCSTSTVTRCGGAA